MSHQCRIPKRSDVNVSPVQPAALAAGTTCVSVVCKGADMNKGEMGVCHLPIS